MKGADIGVGWIDNNGSIYFQVYNQFHLFLILFIFNRIDMHLILRFDVL
jgi:hypothetical protein